MKGSEAFMVLILRRQADHFGMMLMIVRLITNERLDKTTQKPTG